MNVRKTWLLPMCGFVALASCALTGCKKKTEGHAKFSPGRTAVAYNNVPAGHSRKGSLAIPPP